MPSMTVKMVLTGAYAGKTCVLNGHKFENGVLNLQGDPSSLQHVITYLGRCYQAYPEGSDELELARQRDREAAGEEASNGSGDEVHEAAERGASDPVSGDAGEEHEPSSEGSSVLGDGDADSETGEAGVRSDGDGHEDAGVDEGQNEGNAKRRPVNEKLRQVVLNLNPDVDDHWTSTGKPAMSAIEEAYGETGITRADVEAAAPKWTRDKARNEALKSI